MKTTKKTVRDHLNFLRRTPLHPQWLMGIRKPPPSLKSTQGYILDIGSADRWIERHLDKGSFYIALDYPLTGANLYDSKPTVFADAERLPFPDSCLDGVICFEVLEHVNAPQTVLKEISRVLKPNGKLWLSMPFLYPLHDAPYDFQRYTTFGLRRDIRQSGLEIVSIENTTNAIQTSALMACLALAGGIHANSSPLRWVLLPMAIFMIPMINITAWLVSFFWPNWIHITAGHSVEARKP